MDDEKQVLFREETSRRLDAIEKKIEHLDQIVVRGDGREALTVQVARLETKMAEIDSKMSKLDKIDRLVTELSTSMNSLKSGIESVTNLKVEFESIRASIEASKKSSWSALQIIGFIISVLFCSLVGPLIVARLTGITGA